MDVKTALTSLFILAAPVCFAQQQNNIPTGLNAQQNLNELASDRIGGLVRTYDNRYSGIKGTPFFLENWGKASLVLNGKTKYDNVVLKYNVYDNTILYRKPDGSVLELNTNNLDYFILQDSLGLKNYMFKRTPELAAIDKKAGTQFNAILYEGSKYKLLLNPSKSLLKADYKGGYSANRTHDELLTENAYYIVKSDKTAQKVKLNKKNLLKVLANEQQKVQAYLEKEKIDAGTEDGWIKVLNYYESL
ncbi:hypothetical protein [Pontibacter vulgaris]|uniref:hypothetical protein n=1 Tax=Pontibacter vulgaris TaxID=2905679 RepID=UPI001FA80696|nr:hypothetical protein [Pontibacter vulgaris]